MDIEKALLKETSASFSKKVEEYVWHHDSTYMDALMELQEQSGYETEMVAKLVSKELAAKLAEEVEKLNLLKKKST